ncbi:tRNA glutamyl-Q(34) synthetase GluQRS [Aestuariibius sp. 2305UL40-4]|uniref:tRNA glutamyl-Q(34) synthetase GluQRS n=1 Tax=Aestuariibius violaceus TaxID=3234132 RepID=UPI00345EBFE9
MRTRFAPSPTGPLHLGHAFSAMTAYDLARAEGGTFLLRIEDIDQSRARPDWEAQIYDDLHWLVLDWPKPVLRQSERMEAYNAALDTLWRHGLLYPCTCTRRDIEDALSAPQEGAPLIGPDGLIYPGTCRPDQPLQGPRPKGFALRLDVTKAVASLDTSTFKETGRGPHGEVGDIRISPKDLIQNVGDIVLARRDMGTSYHLSVVLDDAYQKITHVVRGEDLFEATQIHVLLQRLLGLPTPIYHHHRLIRDDTGKRLAKRDDARALARYRAEGLTPTDIRQKVGLTTPSATVR